MKKKSKPKAITLIDLKNKLKKNMGAKYYDPDLSFDMGMAIEYFRCKKGLTQKQLADKLGTFQSNIARLENGSIKFPTLKTLEKLCRVFKVSLEIRFIED